MPIYEFRCPLCGQVYECNASINARYDLQPTCGKCGKLMKRTFSRPTIVIKDSVKAGGHDIPKV